MKLGILNTAGLCSLNQEITLANISVVSLICYHPYAPFSLKLTKNENQRTGGGKKYRPPRGLKGLQLSLYVLTDTKEEKDEGHGGQAITSTGRQKGQKRGMDRRSISTRTIEPGR